MPIEKGAAWSRPAGGPPDLSVAGTDAELASALLAHGWATGLVRVAWQPAPGADLARAVGLGGGTTVGSHGLELPCDVMRVEGHSAEGAVELVAVNVIVVGVAPDHQRRHTRRRPVRVEVDGRVVHDGRAAGVVVACGQHLRGGDLVPRGHPGDGRIEVQVYTVAPGQRAAMRGRLPQGTHVPHPGIRQASGTQVTITSDGRAAPLEVDGVRRGDMSEVRVTVRPASLLLLV